MRYSKKNSCEFDLLICQFDAKFHIASKFTVYVQSTKINRKTNYRKLYEKRLAGDRSEFAVTLDEALIYLDDSNGQSKIC